MKRRMVIHFLSRYRRIIITLVVLTLLIFVMIPQTDALWRSLDIVRQASPWLVLLSLFMTAMTYSLSAEIYHMLLKHSIPLRTMMLVQAATALTSRVAPIGVGTMGLNVLFLRRQRHKLSEAVAVVATNNGIGFIGHCILLAIVATTSPLPQQPSFSIGWNTAYYGLLILAAIILTLTLSSRLRRSIFKALGSLFEAIAGYRRHPRVLAAALGTSIVLSCAYVLALVAAAQALGVMLPFNQVFIIYTFSLLTGAATPTPGGLVGVEAGLVAGFVAYGVDTNTALAVALLYRLVTYWLPLIPGFIAFRIVQHRYF